MTLTRRIPRAKDSATRCPPIEAAKFPGEVTRHIRGDVQNMLWGKAAGRCEFNGCNKPLWKSSVTQEQVNIAQKAHIYAFSSDGPRATRVSQRKSLAIWIT